jgi:hypothetical protein
VSLPRIVTCRTPGQPPRRAITTLTPPPLLPPLKTQWVSSGVAIAILWGFVIAALDDPVGVNKELQIWKSWVSVNFGWFFIVAFVSVTPHEL